MYQNLNIDVHDEEYCAPRAALIHGHHDVRVVGGGDQDEELEDTRP